jgi:hypothetical protein
MLILLVELSRYSVPRTAGVVVKHRLCFDLSGFRPPGGPSQGYFPLTLLNVLDILDRGYVTRFIRNNCTSFVQEITTTNLRAISVVAHRPTEKYTYS